MPTQASVCSAKSPRAPRSQVTRPLGLVTGLAPVLALGRAATPPPRPQMLKRSVRPPPSPARHSLGGPNPGPPELDAVTPLGPPGFSQPRGPVWVSLG